jgi:outer membrane lipoprotein SlyB
MGDETKNQPEEEHHSKAKGAAVGAVVGDLIGGKKGAVAGAAIGAERQHSKNEDEKKRNE